jgi:hypothetical protein
MTNLDPTWMATGDALTWMAEHGSAVDLGWDEESQLWTCAWVTSGRRFVGQADRPLVACTIAANGALDAARALLEARNV